MTDPAPADSPVPDPQQALEADIDEAITLCGGDVRAALRATLIANAFLATEIERLTTAVSSGFARVRLHMMPI
jgi:hypothetical protein